MSRIHESSHPFLLQLIHSWVVEMTQGGLVFRSYSGMPTDFTQGNLTPKHSSLFGSQLEGAGVALLEELSRQWWLPWETTILYCWPVLPLLL